MTIDPSDAMSNYADALYAHDLAGQVEGIRQMAQSGMSIDAICEVTECKPEFIQSLLA